jgi:tRNA uridine 5-carboxymethylaminomethyl modification enzyme
MLKSKSVVLTTGTFLSATCHIGQEVFPAGRFMRSKPAEDGDPQIKLEPPSNALAQSIKRLNFPIGRLRTGTPPRLSKKTINYDGL